MIERKLDLGNSLALYLCDIDDFREQDKNARIMEKHKFEQLIYNISKEKRLESFPLCYIKKNPSGNEELYIISGHHRVRASRAAGVLKIYALVFERELTPDEIKSKQLSHNSLSGYDESQILKEIYESISNLELKSMTGVTQEDLNQKIDEIKASMLEMNIDFEILNILFLPQQKEVYEDAIALLQSNNTIDISTIKDFFKLKEAIQKVRKVENIRNLAGIITRMAKIVIDYYKGDKNGSR